MSDLIELLKSRAGRLEQIFGDGEKGYPGVQPYFCLTSPRRPRPRNLNTSGWPKWMKKDDGSYIWMKLHFPKNRKTVTRWDGDADGRRSAQGEKFCIIAYAGGQ